MTETATPRILIVEDEEVMSVLMCDALTAAGYETVSAGGCELALKLYAERRFDLVITDIVMLDMNGLELIAALLKADPTAAVIAVSGGGLFTSESYMKTAALLGAKATLCKPFSIASLVETVLQALEDKAVTPAASLRANLNKI